MIPPRIRPLFRSLPSPRTQSPKARPIDILLAQVPWYPAWLCVPAFVLVHVLPYYELYSSCQKMFPLTDGPRKVAHSTLEVLRQRLRISAYGSATRQKPRLADRSQLPEQSAARSGSDPGQFATKVLNLNCYRISDSCRRSLWVARKSVFLTVPSVVLRIPATVLSCKP